VLTVAVLGGMLFSVAGSAAYAIATTTVAHSGSIPSVGSTSSSSGGMGGAGGTFPGGGGTPPTGGGDGSAPTGTRPGSSDSSGTVDDPTDATGTTDGTAADGAAGTTGTDSSALDALLQATTGRWAAAVSGSQSAATLELSSDTAVMAIGGWSSDPTPTLAEFKAYVADGDIGYYIASGQGGGMGGASSSSASAISAWVEATFTSTTVGGSTVYDLSGYTG
jgi:hypothetical protein